MKMRLLISGFAAVMFLSSCKSETRTEIAPPVDSLAKIPGLSTTPNGDLVERFTTINDTVGLAAFLDSLRQDLARGRMEFIKRNLANGAHGGSTYSGLWDSSGVFFGQPDYERSTARLLAWLMEGGGASVDTSKRLGDSSWMVFVPTLDTRGVEFAPPMSEPTGEEDAEDMETCQVAVVAKAPILRATPAGDSIGILSVDRVCTLSQQGGTTLAGYHGVIGWSWVQVKTPDGTTGWVDGKALRDARGPGLTLRLVHVERGWKVADFNAWGEE